MSDTNEGSNGYTTCPLSSQREQLIKALVPPALPLAVIDVLSASGWYGFDAAAIADNIDSFPRGTDGNIAIDDLMKIAGELFPNGTVRIARTEKE